MKIIGLIKKIFFNTEYIVYVLDDKNDIVDVIVLKSQGQASAIIKATNKMKSKKKYYYKVIPISYNGNYLSNIK